MEKQSICGMIVKALKPFWKSNMHTTSSDKKTVLLFDFDGTLFDTAKLKQAITQKLKHFTSDIELLWETEKKLRNNRYHMVDTIQEFCQKVGLKKNQDIVQNIFLTAPSEEFVFDDIFTTLPKLHQNHITAIFSEGDESYQQVKIGLSKLQKLFDYTFVYHRKTDHWPDIIQLFEGKKLWLIDNQLHHLQHAQKSHSQIHTIWINREDLTPSLDFQPEFEIQSTQELLSIEFS